MPRLPIAYPQSLAHNRAEAGRKAIDDVDLFVWILTHELSHAMACHVADTPEALLAMNHEPFVRNAAWDVLAAFRHQRPGMDLDREGVLKQ